MLEQVIQNRVGERRIRIKLNNLADSRRIHVVEIPSGDLLPFCFDEHLLQTPISSQLISPLQNPAQRTLVILGMKQPFSSTFGQARQECLASQFLSRNAKSPVLRRAGKLFQNRRRESVQR